MMGSGKTTVGRELAIRLNVPFYDTDQIISSEVGMSISAYFEKFGKDSFRVKELELVNNWSIATGVVATGGGLPVYNANIEKLKALGKVIYLRCDISAIISRLSKAKNERPLLSMLTANEFEMKIKTLRLERHLTYAKAHFTIDANHRIEVILSEILTELS